MSDGKNEESARAGEGPDVSPSSVESVDRLTLCNGIPSSRWRPCLDGGVLRACGVRVDFDLNAGEPELCGLLREELDPKLPLSTLTAEVLFLNLAV